MITFKITFLIGFCAIKPKKDLKQNRKQKNENVSKNKEKSKNKRKKQNHKDNNINTVDQQIETVMPPEYVIMVHQPINWAHISYELVPKKISYDIDVVSWGPVAKVYSSDGKKIIKTVTIGEQTWVPICVKHYIQNLKNSELEALREHVVNFVINPDKNSLGSEAKSDNPQQFFLRQEDVNKKGFITAFSENPNVDAQLLKLDRNSKDVFSELKQIVLECSNSPTMKCPLVSWLNYDFLNKDYLYEIIEKISQNEDLNCKQFVTICPPPPQKEILEKEEEDILLKLTKEKKPPKKRKEKRNHKSKNKKKKVETKKRNLTIQVPGEIFFTEPDFSMYQDNCNFLQTCHALAFLSVENLFTRSQKIFYNPIIIKIDKIYNLPSKILIDQGFSELYIKYEIPRIAKCCTPKKRIQDQININESHIFFTNNVPKYTLIKFFQANRLLVEIHGLRTMMKTEEKKPLIFGMNPHDKYYSNVDNLNKIINEKKFEEDVIIGIVSFDLQSLCSKDMEFKEDGQIHETGSFLYRKFKPFTNNPRIINLPINELNSALKTEYEAPLKESILLENNSSLSLLAKRILYQSSSLILHASEALEYIRMVITTENAVIATDIANHLFWNNYKNQNNPRELITGFIIDESVNYIIFIEGVLAGAMMTIWFTVETYNEKLCSVYFNADYIFKERLYNCFGDVGGIYLITLIECIPKILNKSLYYVEGSIPIHCKEALKKLNMLLLCNNIRCMHQMNLFPSPEELVCLNKEWGVPFDWKNINETDSLFSTSTFT